MQQTRKAGELERLIAACATGDQGAFSRLYQLESPRLYGLALRMTRDAGLAADALHEAMLQVWTRASRFDAAVGTPESWMTGLLRYRAIDILRKYGHVRPGLDVEAAMADPDPDAFELLSTSDDGARLRACLDGLEERYRRIVTLSFLDGLSHTELAERTGTPLGTIKSWIRRGLIGLKECLRS